MSVKERAINTLPDWAAKKCENCKRDMVIDINGLAFKQAMKVLLTHERNRHYMDIDAITADLEALADVELPENLPIDSWFSVKEND